MKTQYENTELNTTGKDSFNENTHNSYYVTVPAMILEDKSLSDDELVTFLHLSNFLKRDGYATCSDQWLAEKRNCDERTIQRHLKALEEKGYIYRQSWKEGMYWKRRIWLASAYALHLKKNDLEDNEFKKCLREDKNVGIEKSFLSLSTSQKCRHNKISTKYKKNTTTHPPDAGPPPPAPASSFLSKQEKKILMHCTPEEHAAYHKFCEEYLKPIAENYEAIRISCAKNKWWKKANDHHEIFAKNALIAQEIRRKTSYAQTEGTYIQFLNENGDVSIVEFKEPQFEKICEHILRKRGISLADLIKN